MEKNRLVAFSDGVLAIIITIMVLELKVPHGEDFILSFIYLGICWNNHHHMLQATERINGAVLLANLHLLFWLSMFPFVTSWMGQNHFATPPHCVVWHRFIFSRISVLDFRKNHYSL